MDTEAQIAENLKQNIPTQTTTVADPVVSDPVETSVELSLDEITQYKLSQHLGEDFRPDDKEVNQQLSYIYQNISEAIGTQEYPLVVAKMNELMRILGLANAQNPRFKLYQWLKLDQKRSKIEMEMSNVQWQQTT